jgi:hypothetical protein
LPTLSNLFLRRGAAYSLQGKHLQRTRRGSPRGNKTIVTHKIRACVDGLRPPCDCPDKISPTCRRIPA